MEGVKDLLKLGARVDPVIEEYLLRDADPEFHEAILYPIRTGGKRLRPALTLASALAVGGRVKDALPAAAAVELAHNYSLIFDDIIDHSELRRGKPTLWKKYGLSTAILVAVHYRESIAQALNDTRDPTKFSSIMARTLKLLVEGERLDVLFEQSGRRDEPYVIERRRSVVTLNDYLDMVYKKTGALIETACVFGALSGGGGAEEVEALRRYGANLGIAFQVGDDIIDIFGREEVTGKKVGKDIEEHKLGNVVVILALEELPPGEGEELRSILRADEVGSEEIEKAISLISRTKARSRAEELRRSYVREALHALDKLPSSEGKDMLRALAEFVASREY
ncbi:MAG: polyprenyl synthetase family protein [Thermoprotei archaeon]|nr:MAG: polyprenyl synthetase family protein [Thermoprotei archaeon]